MGYSADRFTDGGVAHSLSIFHPDDLKLFNEHIFPERIQFLDSIDPSDHPNYTFSYNYRVKTPRGNYVSLLQRNSIIKSDKRGNPLLSLGILTDITNYADPNKIIHTIDKVACNSQEEHLKKISYKNYFLNQNDRSLSSREKEVLLLMTDGLTSKEIANKLHISEYTVINHRRNMQEKTNTNNATGLIAYALKNDLI
jgi:DNA-binding CsgD family transcriptional regulator